ncbi:hypothetical protein K474DRAFT_1563518, partial [Panus rudis PR-1116 ss-1]
LIDWLRMLYRNITYTVRLGQETSPTFKSHAGILIGDPASPLLWILYMSDLRISPRPDDVHLAGQPYSHHEQADDIALASLAQAGHGLQFKIDELLEWCRVNFMILNAIKTVCIAFGRLPRVLPTFYAGTQPLRFVTEYTYVGVTFSSAHPDLFAAHRENKAKTARRMAAAIFALEAYVRDIPATAARTLYHARLDPHLIHGAEIAPDARSTCLTELTGVQHSYLRRMLGLNSHSLLPPLYSETGIDPLPFRRADCTLRYLLYVLQQKPEIPFAALSEALILARSGKPSLISDLKLALRRLDPPVEFDYYEDFTPALLGDLRTRLTAAVSTHVTTGISACVRLPLLHRRVEYSPADGKPIKQAVRFRGYLTIEDANHRKALCRLICGDHPFAVEQCRRFSLPDDSGDHIPYDWRICRFCRRQGCIEDEAHVLLSC